jgi:hypothetical protein
MRTLNSLNASAASRRQYFGPELQKRYAGPTLTPQGSIEARTLGSHEGGNSDGAPLPPYVWKFSDIEEF